MVCHEPLRLWCLRPKTLEIRGVSLAVMADRPLLPPRGSTRQASGTIGRQLPTVAAGRRDPGERGPAHPRRVYIWGPRFSTWDLVGNLRDLWMNAGGCVGG